MLAFDSILVGCVQTHIRTVFAMYSDINLIRDLCKNCHPKTPAAYQQTLNNTFDTQRVTGIQYCIDAGRALPTHIHAPKCPPVPGPL